MIELHEVTADGIMQPIAGDVVVPAHGTFELMPGANHIMLMDLRKDLLAGDEVKFTLHLASSDGSTFSVDLTVLVKDYAGAVSYTNLDVYKRQTRTRSPCTC